LLVFQLLVGIVLGLMLVLYLLFTAAVTTEVASTLSN